MKMFEELVSFANLCEQSYRNFPSKISFDLREVVTKNTLTDSPVLVYNPDYNIYFFYHKNELYSYSQTVSWFLSKRVIASLDNKNYELFGISGYILEMFDHQEVLRFIDKKNMIEVNILD